MFLEDDDGGGLHVQQCCCTTLGAFTVDLLNVLQSYKVFPNFIV